MYFRSILQMVIKLLKTFPLIRQFVCATFFLVPLLSMAQLECKDLHNGIFYTYWPKSDDHFVSIMQGNKLTEIAVNLGDTVHYRVDWIDDCTFTMQYASGGKKLSGKVLQFNMDHIFFNTI